VLVGQKPTPPGPAHHQHRTHAGEVVLELAFGQDPPGRAKGVERLVELAEALLRGDVAAKIHGEIVQAIASPVLGQASRRGARQPVGEAQDGALRGEAEDDCQGEPCPAFHGALPALLAHAVAERSRRPGGFQVLDHGPAGLAVEAEDRRRNVETAVVGFELQPPEALRRAGEKEAVVICFHGRRKYHCPGLLSTHMTHMFFCLRWSGGLAIPYGDGGRRACLAEGEWL